jgi:MOSC domain-containing protein YiiM
MTIVSLSVGRPREVQWHDRIVLTSIFKTPVDRRLRVTKLNLEGDEQSEGEVGAGDSIELIARGDEGLTVADVVNLDAFDSKNPDLLRRAVESSILPESWRAHFRKRLSGPDA